MSNYLLNEYPLIVIPSLAVEIGLNEAIILQQLHFWVAKKTNVIDGVSWVYNTYSQWNEQFPFWSEKTIKRTITSLQDSGLVISTDRFNKMPIDKTKWYTIDYSTLEKLVSRPSGHIVPSSGSDCPDVTGHIVPTNNHITPDNTTDNIKAQDFGTEISNLRTRYDNDLSELIDSYLDVIRDTRATKKISDSIIVKILQKFDKYDPVEVEYAIRSHMHGKSGAKEEYTFGILKNNTTEKAKAGLSRFKQDTAPTGSKPPKKHWIEDGDWLDGL